MRQPDARSLVSFFLFFRYSKSAETTQFSIKSAGAYMEYWLAGLMLKEGMDVYMPITDYKGRFL